MASRNPQMLHEPLRKRWQHLKKNWDVDGREPFLTATYRDREEQQMLYEQGKTNAKPGQSLHNYDPAYAFDFAFRKPDGTIDWSWQLYEELGEKGKELGLEWGGDWPGLRDGTHLQMPMTYKQAEEGDIPTLPPLEKESIFELLAELRDLLTRLQNNIS